LHYKAGEAFRNAIITDDTSVVSSNERAYMYITSDKTSDTTRPKLEELKKSCLASQRAQELSNK